MPEQAEKNQESLLDEEEELSGQVSQGDVNQVVVYTSDWTVGTIIEQLKSKRIDFYPDFQRRDAWDLTKKSQYVESLILGLPVPQLVLAEKPGEKGKFIVLDGKQRLLTLMQFSGALDGQKNNAFKLQRLDVLSTTLDKKSYGDLEQTAALAGFLDAFQNQTIHSVVIRGWKNEDFLHLVFTRLNTVSVRLSPQELRQALYPGKFVEWINLFSFESSGTRKLLNLKSGEVDFRMRDVELLVRYISFQKRLDRYAGVLSKFLDNTCSEFNALWESQSEKLKMEVSLFDKAVLDSEEILGVNNVGKKMLGSVFQKNLNRALLDVQLYYFSDPKVSAAAIQKKAEILTMAAQLCEDSNFTNSIERTTKSIEAVSTRFIMWGSSLQEVLGIPIRVPKLLNKRLVFE